jgi:hypothetical protein
MRGRGYIPQAMATNGANGHKKKPSKGVTKATPRATPAQQRARREYLRQAGHTFTKEEIDAIRSQWRD